MERDPADRTEVNRTVPATAQPAAQPAAEPTSAVARRHAAGADSARGLLLTVLGEFVLPSGDPTPTGAA